MRIVRGRGCRTRRGARPSRRPCAGHRPAPRTPWHPGLAWSGPA